MFAVEGTVDGDVRRMVLIVAGQPLPPPRTIPHPDEHLMAEMLIPIEKIPASVWHRPGASNR